MRISYFRTFPRALHALNACGPQPSIKNDGTVAPDKNPIFKVQAQPTRQGFALTDSSLASEVRRSVSVTDSCDFLVYNRALVQSRRDIMTSRTDQLDTACMSLFVGTCPHKRGQQSIPHGPEW